MVSGALLGVAVRLGGRCRGWEVVVGAVAGWVGGDGLSAGGGPSQAAVGEAGHGPAGGLVAEPVVVAAQAAQVVGAGGAGGPGGVVVEVAADGGGAAAGEAAAPVAGADEPVEAVGGAVAGGGRWWAEAGAAGWVGAGPRPVRQRGRPQVAACRMPAASVRASSWPEISSTIAIRGRWASAVPAVLRSRSSSPSRGRGGLAVAERSSAPGRRRRSAALGSAARLRPLGGRSSSARLDVVGGGSGSASARRRRCVRRDRPSSPASAASVGVGLVGSGQQAEGVGEFADQHGGHRVAVELAGLVAAGQGVHPGDQGEPDLHRRVDARAAGSGRPGSRPSAGPWSARRRGWRQSSA